MRKRLHVLALAGILALVAAACAEETPDGGNGTTGGALPGADVLACQVTDTGGVDDKSFNQTANAGLLRAEDELGIEQRVLESQTEADYAPNIETFLQQDCDIIIPVGFLLADATAAAAEANPNQLFGIVDYDFTDFTTTPPTDVTYDNVRELIFQTDEAAFLAGYVAAGMTESGTVATLGGAPIGTVTIFMNGFAAGIALYNQDNGTDVELLGWDPVAQDGSFVSPDPTVGFVDEDGGRRVAEDLIAEGADIIMPVAGPSGLGSAAAAQDAGGVSLIWVDVDGCVSAEEFCSLFLTSVEKHMDTAVFETINSVVEDRFEGGLYVGTLENDGIGIAPFNEFEDDVPQELKDRVEELREGIIAGDISVDPADYA